MGDIKKILSYWDSRISKFDAKLVAREETGCCGSATMKGSPDCECICNQ